MCHLLLNVTNKFHKCISFLSLHFFQKHKLYGTKCHKTSQSIQNLWSDPSLICSVDTQHITHYYYQNFHPLKSDLEGSDSSDPYPVISNWGFYFGHAHLRTTPSTTPSTNYDCTTAFILAAVGACDYTAYS